MEKFLFCEDGLFTFPQNIRFCIYGVPGVIQYSTTAFSTLKVSVLRAFYRSLPRLVPKTAIIDFGKTLLHHLTEYRHYIFVATYRSRLDAEYTISGGYDNRIAVDIKSGFRLSNTSVVIRYGNGMKQIILEEKPVKWTHPDNVTIRIRYWFTVHIPVLRRKPRDYFTRYYVYSRNFIPGVCHRVWGPTTTSDMETIITHKDMVNEYNLFKVIEHIHIVPTYSQNVFVYKNELHQKIFWLFYDYKQITCILGI